MLYVRDSIKQAFTDFQRDPINHLQYSVRLIRSAQIRNLLAHPERVDLETFNHEFWRYGPRFTFLSITTDPDNFPPNLTDAWISAFREAIEDGGLALHGNYIWNSGAQKFDAQRPDDAVKLGHVREALVLVNDPVLTPREKAQRIDNVYGFGRNNATGLVMLFHPSEFAIENKRSEGAVRRLGYNGLDFQAIVMDLKDQLGARDFLELDIFLEYIFIGAIPLDLGSEVDTVEQFLDAQAGRSLSRQGFRTDPEARRVIEAYAMQRASAYYQAQGWVVENVSGQKPYDLHCIRGSKELRVEVKGTTSNGGQILLTRNEVLHARDHARLVALFIVKNIVLTAANPQASPEASGGLDVILEPWQIEDTALTALAYTYAVPRQ